MSEPLVISMGGVIGAGKSTCLRVLKNADYGLPFCLPDLKIGFVDEPVEKFTLLSKFCTNPKKYAYLFQQQVFRERINACRLAVKTYGADCDVWILERSVIDDANIFFDLQYQFGNVTDEEFNEYHEWWNFWPKLMPVIPSAYMFVDTDIVECGRRVKTRNRQGESVDEDYNSQLRTQHTKFFSPDRLSVKFPYSRNLPLLVVDGANNFASDQTHKNILVQEVVDFIIAQLG